MKEGTLSWSKKKWLRYDKELAIGSKKNSELNSEEKREWYKILVDRLTIYYNTASYANISIGECGIIENRSKKFETMEKLKSPEIRYSTRCIINICIDTSYSIIYFRNKECKRSLNLIFLNNVIVLYMRLWSH